MPEWKVVAVTPLLLVPLAVLGVSVADGPEHKAATPAMVLPAAAVEGPQVTMRREKPTSRPQPQPRPAPKGDCTGHDPGNDDDDDDGVEFVHPCPGAVGDDEGDDDDDGDD
jgi:hypothetical protein